MIVERIALAFLLFTLSAPASVGQDPPNVDDAAEARLDAPVTLHFPDETPLQTVLDAIRKEAGKDLVVEVNQAALKKAGITEDFEGQDRRRRRPAQGRPHPGRPPGEADLLGEGLEGDRHG